MDFSSPVILNFSVQIDTENKNLTIVELENLFIDRFHKYFFDGEYSHSFSIIDDQGKIHTLTASLNGVEGNEPKAPERKRIIRKSKNAEEE
jgi:hypothetical protein